MTNTVNVPQLPLVATDIVAWGQQAQNHMIVVTSNMETKSDGKAVMGRGVALAVRDAFPGIDAEHGDTLTKLAISLSAKAGQATSKLIDLPEALLRGRVFMSSKERVVFMPTKTSWRKSSNPEFVVSNLRALRELALEMQHMHFGLPLPGAGNGELGREWAINQCNAILGDLKNITLIEKPADGSAPARVPVVNSTSAPARRQTARKPDDIAEFVSNEVLLVVTGHRPVELGGYSPVIRQYTREVATHILKYFIKQYGTTCVVHGGALGVDMAFADAAEELGLKTIYAEPCLNASARWNRDDQNRAERQKAYAVATGRHVVVTPTPYTSQCMQDRNIWMLRLLARARKGSKFVSLYNGKGSGGTYNCREAFFEMYRGEQATELNGKNWWTRFTEHHPMPNMLEVKYTHRPALVIENHKNTALVA